MIAAVMRFLKSGQGFAVLQDFLRGKGDAVLISLAKR